MPRTEKKRLLIIGNGRKPAVRATVKELRPWFKRRALVVGEDLDEKLDIARVEADLAIIFGGDGSILSTVRRLGTNPIPVLGINFGKLGFLTELSHPGMRTDLDRALKGHLVVKELMRLRYEVLRSGRRVARGLAVNDVTTLRRQTRMISLDLEHDGEPVTSYYADGLIVSTPVGSTAYSMAAGGPIIHSDMEAMVITPICPHALAFRPLVVSAEGTVVVRVAEAGEGVRVISDGQDSVLARKGDEIRIEKSEKKFLLAHVGTRSYFETLSTKLSWGARGDSP